jgi:hypothetical protein
MMRRKYTGRAFVLAALFALCAMLIPSQANAALVKPTKVTVNNGYSVLTCSATKTGVDLVNGTTTYKMNATARAAGFNGFKNVQTDGYCFFGDAVGNWNAGSYQAATGKNSFNQTTSLVEFTGSYTHVCGQVVTIQKNGNVGNQINCTPIS